ncbi:unnamed protein product [Fraxinus pennsylvanica]|uniref:Uncharacterized protein n=1 Tax=Fraxinus pennsylvanica TaxID=56036 RepID=A0AAD1ZYC6_9LAMI|nr:unnamed protein product [Fraxinus pennsylvanica]
MILIWTLFLFCTILNSTYIFISDKKQVLKESQKSLNVNEEYLGAFRTKSYGDFCIKAQLLVNESSSPANYCHKGFLEILDPGQETIAQVLESAVLSRKSNLKSLLFNYFDMSAEASKFCSQLLKSINQVQADYKFIYQALDTIDDYSSEKFHLIVFELHSCILNLKKQDFKCINEKYTSILQRLKSKRKMVTRKIKLIKWFNKASGVCMTLACSVISIAAMVLAAHTLTALLMGPVILSLPVKPLKRKLLNIQFLKDGFLRKIGEQLDVATKGTYILNMEFDTMSRLMARIQDEIEHNKAMIQFCLDRKEDKFSFQALLDLKKGEFGFKKQVQELEEHVYLCLVTINRARALVIREITKSWLKNSTQ